MASRWDKLRAKPTKKPLLNVGQWKTSGGETVELMAINRGFATVRLVNPATFDGAQLSRTECQEVARFLLDVAEQLQD